MNKVFMLVEEKIDVTEPYDGSSVSTVLYASLEKEKIEEKFGEVLEKVLDDMNLDADVREELERLSYYEFDSYDYIDIGSKNFANICNMESIYSLFVAEKELM